MKGIIIYTNHGEIKTEIPVSYIDDDMILYWIDVVCKEDVSGWYDYMLMEDIKC